MKKLITAAVIIICLGVAGFGAYKILQMQVLSPDKLPDNVTINGIDCSNLTIAEIQEKLTDKWNSRTLIINEDGKEADKFTDFDFSYAIDKEVVNLRKDHFFDAVCNRFFGREFKATVTMEISKVSDTFAKRVEKAKVFKPENLVKTKNATVDLKTDDFNIIPEVQGNNTDYDLLIGDMVQSISENKMSFEYNPGEYYEVPKITKYSDEIEERVKFCREYLTSKVTYSFGSQKVTIPPIEIDKMIDVIYPKTKTESVKVVAKKSKVEKYVEKLSDKYGTVGGQRSFTSLSGNQISVSGGNYGYSIDVDKETAKLVKDLEGTEKVTREPVWDQKGWGTYDENNDLGNTYVEISIYDQHLWYFKNGKRIVDCDVVTGNPEEGADTPPGTYQLTFKERGATLRGFNSDGSKYESPVSYWMPFYGNYGMHDASWRDTFGGKIYRGNGSHGCVNMPIPSAKKLYRNLASSGTPVVVHK